MSTKSHDNRPAAVAAAATASVARTWEEVESMPSLNSKIATRIIDPVIILDMKVNFNNGKSNNNNNNNMSSNHNNNMNQNEVAAATTLQEIQDEESFCGSTPPPHRPMDDIEVTNSHDSTECSDRTVVSAMTELSFHPSDVNSSEMDLLYPTRKSSFSDSLSPVNTGANTPLSLLSGAVPIQEPNVVPHLHLVQGNNNDSTAANNPSFTFNDTDSQCLSEPEKVLTVSERDPEKFNFANIAQSLHPEQESHDEEFLTAEPKEIDNVTDNAQQMTVPQLQINNDNSLLVEEPSAANETNEPGNVAASKRYWLSARTMLWLTVALLGVASTMDDHYSTSLPAQISLQAAKASAFTLQQNSAAMDELHKSGACYVLNNVETIFLENGQSYKMMTTTPTELDGGNMLLNGTLGATSGGINESIYHQTMGLESLSTTWRWKVAFFLSLAALIMTHLKSYSNNENDTHTNNQKCKEENTTRGVQDGLNHIHSKQESVVLRQSGNRVTEIKMEVIHRTSCQLDAAEKVSAACLDLSRYAKLRVVDLKELLRCRGCKVSGVKAELIVRLVQSYVLELELLTVKDLRERLRERELKISGRKQDLIRRLVEVGVY